MAVFTEINYKKKIETGKISIHCNEDYNFVLVAGGRLPRKKDVLRAVDLLYKELDKDNSREKLDTFLIEVKSKRSQTKKRKWSKNRKSVWSNNPGQVREEFYSQLFKR